MDLDDSWIETNVRVVIHKHVERLIELDIGQTCSSELSADKFCNGY